MQITLEPMNPDAILGKVRKTYLGFRSYRDRGTVDQFLEVGKTSLEFKTYFSRPSKVRFEWRTWHPFLGTEGPIYDSMFCSDGDEVRMWFMDQLRTCVSLSHAINCATGVSSGSVLQILKLLLPDCIETRRTWYEMRNARKLEDEEVRGWPCYHLVGTSLKRDDEEVWISHDDFIVRRRLHRSHISLDASKRYHARAKELLRETGRPTDFLEKPKARKYSTQFDYQQVIINKPVSRDLFESI